MNLADLFESEFFMQLLTDKETLIKSILKDIQTTDHNIQSFNKLIKLYAEGTPVNLDKVGKAFATAISNMSEMNMHMLVLLLVYSQGTNFTADTGAVLCRLGKGEEALQAMLRAKLRS